MIKAEKALLLCCCKDLSGSNCMLKLNRIKATPPRGAPVFSPSFFFAINISKNGLQKPILGFCRRLSATAPRGGAAFMRFNFCAQPNYSLKSAASSLAKLFCGVFYKAKIGRLLKLKCLPSVFTKTLSFYFFAFAPSFL